MDFSFTPEQDDLRREARSFLEANPSPSMAQLTELGWVGILRSDDFGFLDAAVLFEELGRVALRRPVRAQRGRRASRATTCGRSRSTASCRTSRRFSAC